MSVPVMYAIQETERAREEEEVLCDVYEMLEMKR